MRKEDIDSIKVSAYFFAKFILVTIIIFIIIVFIANLDTYEEDKFDAERICTKLQVQSHIYTDSIDYYIWNLDSLNADSIINKTDILIFSKECISFKFKGRIYTEIPIFEDDKRTHRAYTYYEDEDEMLKRKIDEIIKKAENYFLEHGKYTYDLNLLHIDEKFLGKGVKINEFTKNDIEIEYEGEKITRKK
ncbi:MAG: hypothetical protein PF574_04050 [Candidatus Delongbacteria bacterium]|nr:hypothetical protein [Candidatus Delongbacteria bacterium]